MWNNRKLILIFYKPVAALNIIVDLLVIYFIHLNGWRNVMTTLLFKGLGYGAVFGYQYLMSQKNFFYYRNAGVSMRMVYVQAFTLDFLLFVLMLAAYYPLSK